MSVRGPKADEKQHEDRKSMSKLCAVTTQKNCSFPISVPPFIHCVCSSFGFCFVGILLNPMPVNMYIRMCPWLIRLFCSRHYILRIACSLQGANVSQPSLLVILWADPVFFFGPSWTNSAEYPQIVWQPKPTFELQSTVRRASLSPFYRYYYVFLPR